MGAVRETITPALAEFIAGQHVFFVATAPSGPGGHVNLSPKGLDTFAVLDERRVAYLDLTGSGVETIAHLRDDGRITIMFCAFEGSPTILRLYGRGEAIPVDDPRAQQFLAGFKPYPGARSVIVVDVERVSTSCGYAVPFMAFERERDRLVEWAENKGDDGIVEYRAEKNAASIDGLPGLPG